MACRDEIGRCGGLYELDDGDCAWWWHGAGGYVHFGSCGGEVRLEVQARLRVGCVEEVVLIGSILLLLLPHVCPIASLREMSSAGLVE